jgi:hypothetical protein
MTAQEVFQSLIEEKLQVQIAGVRQSENEAGEPAAGPANRHFPKVGPVHLSLFGGEHVQTQKRFRLRRAQ